MIAPSTFGCTPSAFPVRIGSYIEPRMTCRRKRRFPFDPEDSVMGLLADWQIKKEIKIEPFAEESHRPGVISYGLSSYGYDVRVGRSFKVFTNVYGAVIDPKKFDPSAFVDIEGDSCIIPPNSFALAETVET